MLLHWHSPIPGEVALNDMDEYGTIEYLFRPVLFKVLECNHMVASVRQESTEGVW